MSHFSSKLFLLMICRKSRLMLTVCWPFGHFKSNYHHHSILFIIHSLYTIQHPLSEFVEREGPPWMNPPLFLSCVSSFIVTWSLYLQVWHIGHTLAKISRSIEQEKEYISYIIKYRGYLWKRWQNASALQHPETGGTDTLSQALASGQC